MTFPFAIQQQPGLKCTVKNRVMNFCRVAPLALVLLMCGCTLFTQKKNSTPSTIDPSATTINHTDTSTSYKLQLHGYYYHADSELLRKYQLINMHHGSPDPANYFHDADRLTAPSMVQTVHTDWSKKPIEPWSNFEFVLNDRWQLSADLPDFSNFANGNRSYIPTPRLTYDYGAIKLSTLYIPQIQNYNLISAMGIYLIITF